MYEYELPTQVYNLHSAAEAPCIATGCDIAIIDSQLQEKCTDVGLCGPGQVQVIRQIEVSQRKAPHPCRFLMTVLPRHIYERICQCTCEWQYTTSSMVVC